jgi:YHS domain-containing protein
MLAELRCQAAVDGRAGMQALLRRSVMGALASLIAVPMQLARAAEPTAVLAKRIALQGYDPVAYFTKGRPEKGSPDFSASFDGATYWFATAEHRDRFTGDPDRYAPQFGGFCAIRISRGEKYEADPQAWVIADGKLYVFGGKEGVPIFRRQTASIVKDAAEHWPELHGSP